MSSEYTVKTQPLTEEQRSSRERARRQITVAAEPWREQFKRIALAARTRARFGALSQAANKETGRAV